MVQLSLLHCFSRPGFVLSVLGQVDVEAALRCHLARQTRPNSIN